MLEMPCGRVDMVLMSASSFVSCVAGLTRRLCDRRRSQTLTMLNGRLKRGQSCIASGRIKREKRGRTRRPSQTTRAGSLGAANK